MADAPPAAKPAKSPFLYLMIFMMVMLLVLNPVVYSAIGQGMATVLGPVLGFGGRFPVLTLVLASVLTVAVTTYLRHLLTDWVGMGRAQELMRAFNREFSKARKDNNLHKIKKLQEKQADMFKMQAEMSGGQFKPMLITMVVVIPVFAWLLLFMSTPASYDITASGETLVMAGGGVHFLAPQGSDRFSAVGRTDVAAWALEPGASAGIARNGKVHRLLPPEALAWDAFALTNATPGTQNASVTGSISAPGGPYTSALLLVKGAQRSARWVSSSAQVVEIPEGAAVYAVVPAASAAGASGTLTLSLGEMTFALGPERLLGRERAASTDIVPHSAEVPWDANWDLNGIFLFIPHWIMLYTIFSLPLGQLLMRWLKSYEFRQTMPHHAVG